jgi:hypothetical protein
MKTMKIALVVSLLVPGLASANSWQAAAYANQQRVHQVGQQIVNAVREGRINSGAQVIQHWQNNYRPQIPSGALNYRIPGRR